MIWHTYIECIFPIAFTVGLEVSVFSYGAEGFGFDSRPCHTQTLSEYAVPLRHVRKKHEMVRESEPDV